MPPDDLDVELIRASVWTLVVLAITHRPKPATWSAEEIAGATLREADALLAAFAERFPLADPTLLS